MTKPLSMDIRERAMARLDAGETVRAMAEALSVAPSSVVKWSQRRRATGSAAPGKIGGHVPRNIRGEAADVARKRARWKARLGGIDIQRLVFIDETWAKTNMAPLRGWATRGKRLIGHAPFGHWNKLLN